MTDDRERAGGHLEIPVYLKGAVSLFLLELEEHIRIFDGAVAPGAGEAEVRSALGEHAKPFGERFHLIKGGAGFLRLDAMRDAAAAGERLAKSGPGEPGAAERLHEIVDTLRQGAEALRRALGS